MQTSITADAASSGEAALPQPPIAQNPTPVIQTPNAVTPGLDKPPDLANTGPTLELVPASALPITPLSIPKPLDQKREPLTIDPSLGTIELRSPDEDREFHECEVIVGTACQHFAKAGDALIRIRDKQLYKNEHQSFEQYCQERWGFGRSQTSRYVAAAQVYRALQLITGIPMPDCEAQVRPLIGLTPELAQRVWLDALSWSPNSYVPAKLVTRALRRVLKTEEPAVEAAADARKQLCSRRRESIRTGFRELLALLVGTVERAVLIAKVQEIQRLLEPILSPKKTKR